MKDLLMWFKAKSSGLVKLSKDVRDLSFSDLLGQEKDFTPTWTKKTLAPISEKDQFGRKNCSFQMASKIYGIYFGENISARYLTAKAWQLGLCTKGGEADMRAWCKIGYNHGVVPEADCPSDERLAWEDYVNVDFAKLDVLASQYKIGSYYRVMTVNDLLRAIDKGYAVGIGRDWLVSMNQSGGFKVPWVIRRLGSYVGGHATTCVGIDLAYNGERVTIESNSYSNLWGDKGQFYCPLRDLQKDLDLYGAYAITPIPYSPKEIKISLIKKAIEIINKIIDFELKNT